MDRLKFYRELVPWNPSWVVVLLQVMAAELTCRFGRGDFRGISQKWPKAYAFWGW